MQRPAPTFSQVVAACRRARRLQRLSLFVLGTDLARVVFPALECANRVAYRTKRAYFDLPVTPKGWDSVD